jgi:D-glycero-beta-D-manno-heptose 1-phosphate adenylyltransferase
MGRLQTIQAKIVTVAEARQRIAMWHLKEHTVVFTNGCFDILHTGHVTYLAEAASLGSKLIVAINTDASVKRLGKGADRPINSEASRAFVLAGLGFIDLVVLFNNDTPLEVIKELLPDVLVKGADYDSKERNPLSKRYIVGADIVSENGGRVEAIALVEGFSTTAIIDRMKQ